MSIDDDALDFVWAVVARAVEPRVGAYLRMVWGNDARIGLSLAQHMALSPLPPDRHARLLEILDPNHPLRLNGILEIAPEDRGVIDVGTRWIVAQRVWRFLRGDDALEPMVSRFGGLVTTPHASALSEVQRTTIDRLGEWLASRQPLTILLDHAKELADLLKDHPRLEGQLAPRITKLIGLVDQILVDNPYLKRSFDEAIDPIRNVK